MADSEGSLRIDPAALKTAADSYSAEETKFTTTTEQLQAALLGVLSVWEDDSNENWKSKVNEACQSLSAVNELLKANKQALDDIAEVAQTSETSVATGVGNL